MLAGTSLLIVIPVAWGGVLAAFMAGWIMCVREGERRERAARIQVHAPDLGARLFKIGRLED